MGEKMGLRNAREAIEACGGGSQAFVGKKRATLLVKKRIR